MSSTSTQKPSNGHFPDTQNIMSFILSTIDRIVSPQTRQRAYNAVFRFCYQRPVLSSFLGVQLLFAFVPLLCFIGFSVSAILILSALALGIGLFWVLLAGIVLFWALVITFTLAAGTWIYLAFCFVTVRRIGRATGYIEAPGAQKGRSTTKTSGSNTNTQDVNVEEEQKKKKEEEKKNGSSVLDESLGVNTQQGDKDDSKKLNGTSTDIGETPAVDTKSAEFVWDSLASAYDNLLN